MMDESISRQDACKALLNECHIKIMSGNNWIRLEEAVAKLSALPTVQPEIVRCKDCKHFHYDMPYVIQGVPVLGHEVCDFWGDGCKTSDNGFCSYAERRTDG